MTQNMSVYANDDSKMGDVKHFVVNPHNSEVTHLIIEQGFIFTTDKVLPLDLITRQDGDSLYLDSSSDELDLIDYEESFFVSQFDPEIVKTSDNVKQKTITNDALSVYYYPPLPRRGVAAPYWGIVNQTMSDPVREVVVRHVPDESVVITEGTNVYSRDGDHVGDVHSVHMDPESNQITHFIIAEGMIFQEYKLIPVLWVSDATDERITVAVGTEQLKSLPDFEPETT